MVVAGKSSTLPSRGSGHRTRPGYVKTKSLTELQWLEDSSLSSSKSRHKFGSTDNFIVAGTEAPSTTGDLRRMCLEMSNSASLDRLAVYDQQPRKLSVQVRSYLYVPEFPLSCLQKKFRSFFQDFL